MALYTGNYKDIFHGPATYRLVKTELETVGQTASYTFNGGKDLLVHSGTLKITAQCLIEGYTIQHEMHPVKRTAEWSGIFSLVGANANLYGGFILNSGLAIAGGRLVVSHGFWRWVNANYVKVLMSIVVRKRTNDTDKVFVKTRMLTAVHYVRGKRVTRSPRSSNTS